MLSFIHNHPFAVEAYFESSIILTFAVPKIQIQTLIPECLELDTFDKWAFIAVALVQTKHLRPKGFPEFLGNDFFLVGYRVFVRYTNRKGKRLRGLYILKSQTDKKRMELLGNVFTHYRYTTIDVKQIFTESSIEIKSIQSGLNIIVQRTIETVPLPDQSPFTDWKEARRFAGPLPFTFTYNSNTKEVLIVEGARTNWTPAPIQIKSYDIPLLKDLELDNAVLANAFIVNNVPYYWKKGRLEHWKN